MSNNLFVSFRVTGRSGVKQRRAEALAVIQAHDHWAEVHDGLYYVSVDREAQDLAGRLRAVLGPRDPVIVVDTNGNTAIWHNLPDQVGQYLRAHWNR